MLSYLLCVLGAVIGCAGLVLTGYQLAMLRLRTDPDDLRALRRALETRLIEAEVELASVLRLAEAHRGFYRALQKAARQDAITETAFREYQDLAPRGIREGARADIEKREEEMLMV